MRQEEAGAPASSRKLSLGCVHLECYVRELSAHTLQATVFSFLVFVKVKS